MLWKALILLGLLALPGCASTPEAAMPTLGFAEAKDLVLANRSKLWKDPDSIRDARINQPYSCHGGMVWANVTSCVCIEANARNSFGGYTGLKANEILFRGQEVAGVRESFSGSDRCAALQPFPELNGGVQVQSPAPLPKRR